MKKKNNEGSVEKRGWTRKEGGCEMKKGAIERETKLKAGRDRAFTKIRKMARSPLINKGRKNGKRGCPSPDARVAETRTKRAHLWERRCRRK